MALLFVGVVEPGISRFSYLFTLITRKFEKSTQNINKKKSKEKPMVSNSEKRKCTTARESWKRYKKNIVATLCVQC